LKLFLFLIFVSIVVGEVLAILAIRNMNGAENLLYVTIPPTILVIIIVIFIIYEQYFKKGGEL
jgi:hypothetical protein